MTIPIYDHRCQGAVLDQLKAAVERVRAVHPRIVRPHGEPRCDHCDLLWPCPTIEALDGDA